MSRFDRGRLEVVHDDESGMFLLAESFSEEKMLLPTGHDWSLQFDSEGEPFVGCSTREGINIDELLECIVLQRERERRHASIDVCATS